MEAHDAILDAVEETTRRRILDNARAGLSSQAIADELGIDVRTVRRVRKDAGLDAPIGRPATGERRRFTARVDEDVAEAIDSEAERTETTAADVVADVLTNWARAPKRRK